MCVSKEPSVSFTVESGFSKQGHRKQHHVKSRDVSMPVALLGLVYWSGRRPRTRAGQLIDAAFRNGAHLRERRLLMLHIPQLLSRSPAVAMTLSGLRRERRL